MNKKMLNETIIKSSRASLLSDKRQGGGIAFQVWTFLIVAILCSFDVSERIAGYMIHPERVLVMVWLLSMVFIIHAMPRFKIRKTSLLLLVWIALSLFSSLLSIQPVVSFRHWVDLTMAVAFFFLCQTAPLHFLILKRSNAIIWLSIILGAGAVLTYVIHFFGMNAKGSMWASFLSDEGDFSRVRMTLLEPNLFGIGMSVFALLSIAEFRRSDRLTWLSLVLSHTGLILAFSRAPVLGYMLGLIVYAIVVKATGTLLKVGGIVGLLIAAWWGMSGGAFEFFQSHFNRLDSIDARLISLEIAMEDVVNAPFIGNGILSMDFLHPDLYRMIGADTDGGWIPSLPVAILHDTGWVGLLLIYCFFSYVIWAGYKAAKRLSVSQANHQYVRRSGAWVGATVSVLVGSTATPAQLLSLFWGVFAVCSGLPYVVTMLKEVSRKVSISNRG